ncbi:hypothetical protein ACFVDQ_26010 [Streptomyces sp. NPDC057684]|uniref:hypothetical protein n=1 Tax=unclassified Streptomyces TaxID=2593676 RepID=UPI0036A1C333
MKESRRVLPEFLVWAIAWIVVTVLVWLVALMTGSPKSWYTSAILAGIVIVVGEFVDRRKRIRGTRKRNSCPESGATPGCQQRVN